MDSLLFGILSGSILLLGAVGWSLIKKVEGYMDMSYGQYLMLGAYLSWQFYTVNHLPLFLAGLLASLITSGLALVIAKLFYQPIRAYGPTMTLFTSVGIAYILHGSAEAIWGVNAKTIDLGEATMLKIGAMNLLSTVEVGIILVAWLVAFGVHLVLTRTMVGKGIRAMASNYDLAQIRGIETVRMSSYVHLITGFLAGLSGCLIGMKGTIFIDMGWVQVLIILSAVVLGGISASVYGVMAAAMVMGLSMELSVLLPFMKSAYRPAVALTLVIIVLFVKPEGIFTRNSKKRKAEKDPINPAPTPLASSGAA
jgi:branched-subunit amino acid ABC-type transport system permease component